MAGESPPLLSVTSQGSAPRSLQEPQRPELTDGSGSVWKGMAILEKEAKARASGASAPTEVDDGS